MENLDRLNRNLQDVFGIDSDTGRAIFRIVWSEDQFEKRLMNVTDSGLSLLTPEVREVPKYRQWIKEKYVLERLVVVPDTSKEQLAGLKLSYEPLWIFEDKDGNPLPPKYEVCEIVIHTVYAALGKGNLAKYVEPCSEEQLEIKSKEIDKLTQEIFGNETEVSDHLSRQTGVVIDNTSNLVKES